MKSISAVFTIHSSALSPKGEDRVSISVLAVSAVASPAKNLVTRDDGQVGDTDDGQAGDVDDGQSGYLVVFHYVPRRRFGATYWRSVVREPSLPMELWSNSDETSAYAFQASGVHRNRAGARRRFRVKRILWLALVLGAIGLVSAVALAPAATAKAFRGDLTAPADGAPFGGDVVGSYRIDVHGERITIHAQVVLEALDGYTFEGWFVDMQTGYKLSLGELEDGTLRFRQRMVNPWTYGVLVITMEPVGDPDPNPATPAAGALLPAPFGQ